jgi:4'-phosphopantetheinyl transferase
MMAVSLRWLSQGMADAPVDDAWLSPREAAWVARMRFPKRRSEFRLGRWTAKRALALYLGREARPSPAR